MNFEISNTILGERFKSLRKHKNITQQVLSDNSEVPLMAISALENGKGTSINNMLNLINYFNSFYDLSDLVERDFEIKEKYKLEVKIGTEGFIEELVRLQKSMNKAFNTFIASVQTP